MKTSIKRLLGASAVAAAASAMLMTLGGGVASAATPPWEPDPGSAGAITFYNSAGSVITTGPIDQPLTAYASGSQVLRAGDASSALFWFVPQPGVTPPNWNGLQINNFSNYPVTTGPANIQTLSQTLPVTTEGPAGTDPAVSDLEAALPQGSTQAGYANTYQIRLRTATSGGQQTDTYAAADITIDDAAGTWTQVYPAALTATTTALVASPSPSTAGQNVTLTATVSAGATHPAGSVVFKDGATTLNTTPATVNTTTGVATFSTNTLSTATHSLTATFTPTDTATYNGSTGSATLVVNPVSTPTTTTLSITGNTATTGNDVTLTANVAPSAAPGSVAFFDNGSTTAIPGTVTNPTAGQYVLDLPTGFAAGGHSIVAKFAPTLIVNYEASQSAPQAFLTQGTQTGACAQTGSVCTDTQNIIATVPVGTLVINTPYTASSPLDLGTLVLSPDSTELQASASFNNIVVTDTRSGDLPWTVSSLASNLSDGGVNPNSVINAQNLGLTTIQATPGTGFTGTITPTDNPAANGVAPGDTGSLGLGGTTPHTVAAANHGLGTVTMKGTLSLNAPSSTEPGIFQGTITFTVG
jgi:Bacterial Ig-like domain (group 3)